MACSMASSWHFCHELATAHGRRAVVFKIKVSFESLSGALNVNFLYSRNNMRATNSRSHIITLLHYITLQLHYITIALLQTVDLI